MILDNSLKDVEQVRGMYLERMSPDFGTRLYDVLRG